MNSAVSRVKNATSAAKLRVRDAFKNESGAFDLPSIIVGVVVVGILTAGVLAAIFGVIPFAQDKAAQQDLGAITTAQGVAKAQHDGFKNLAGLQAENLLSADLDETKVDTAVNGDGWVAASVSGSDTIFVATSENPTPIEASTVPTNAEVTAVGYTGDFTAAEVAAYEQAEGLVVPNP